MVIFWVLYLTTYFKGANGSKECKLGFIHCIVCL